MFFQIKSLRNRLNILFLLVAIPPLLVAVLVIYVQQVESIKAGAFQKLIAVRDLKVSQVNLWLQERTGDITLLAEVPIVRSLNISMTSSSISNDERAKLDEVRENFKARIKNYNDYEEIFLISAVSGKVVVSNRETLEGTDFSKNSFFTRPMASRDFYIKDIHYSQTLNKPSLTFSAPVFALDDHNQLIGILVARVLLDKSLYSLLLERPGMGATGETLLVNRETIALNELRWYENAPLKLRIDAYPAVQASKGNTGIVEIEDYRNIKVLAAYTYIAETGWGFVAKQDLDEIYKPIANLIRNSLFIIGYSFIIVFLAAFLISKRMAAPLVTMKTIADRLQAGDFSVRNRLNRADEFGDLGRSFDNMADTLTNQLVLQQSIREIMDAIVTSQNFSVFGDNILRLMATKTSSALGAFHLLDREKEQYVVLAALGASSELLEPVSIIQPEGEIGKAIALKEICHLRDIKENTFFHLKSFCGQIVPQEIITLPLIDNGEVGAVLSLASLSGYSDLHVQIIETAWNALNTGHTNLWSTEKLRDMAMRIQKKNQELGEQKIELQRQSNELQEQNVELEAQRMQVEEATRLKSEFLANMSHELRTPLNSIMALSKVLILETEETITSEQRNYLEVIARNGTRLLGLINDILDLSKIEAGRVDLVPKPLSVERFLESIVEGFEVICQQKNIEISLEIPEKLPAIESDDNRVHQILQNIISNSVKFTLEGGVTIRAKRDGEDVVVTVQDTGIGIAEKELPNIFGEFRQVDGSSSRSFEGTGLGLAIARKSAALVEAEIAVTSTPGQGTCFVIRLPISWQGPKYFDDDVPLLASPFESAGKTVLVVDDELETAQEIANYLEDAGYSTLIASSGKKALEMARSHKLFAITMDIVMPDIDGWEVMQKLKEDPETATIPVIIVSISKDTQTGYALGSVDFVEKPVEKTHLLTALEKLSWVKIRSAMVVDDDAMDRQHLTRMLRNESIEVTEADGGHRCLELLLENIPDVIVLDLMMPDMSGFEVLKKLRSSQKTSSTPVLIATAKEITVEEKSFLKEHMAPVIEKDNLSMNTFWLKLQAQLKSLAQPRLKTLSLKESSEKKNILMVEDNPDTVIQVKYILEKAGYNVLAVSSGPEALEQVKHTIPDGIVLDLMMPGFDGFEVLEKIRGSKATARIPVLILTAKDLTRDDLKRLSYNNIQQLVQKGDIDLDGLLFKVELMLDNQPKLSIPQLSDTIPSVTGTLDASTVRSQRKRETPVILIVEDNPDNMITLKAVLKNQYTIVEARDGKEGLMKTLQYKPDLVFLDISLPKMDGYEVVRRIKKDSTISDIPVIALTAHAMKGDEEKARAAGCDDYLLKPIDPEQLAARLEKWLSVR